jgi:hypothetical protein
MLLSECGQGFHMSSGMYRDTKRSTQPNKHKHSLDHHSRHEALLAHAPLADQHIIALCKRDTTVFSQHRIVVILPVIRQRNWLDTLQLFVRQVAIEVQLEGFNGHLAPRVASDFVCVGEDHNWPVEHFLNRTDLRVVTPHSVFSHVTNVTCEFAFGH